MSEHNKREAINRLQAAVAELQALIPGLDLGEFAVLNGVVAGTVTAGKALVVGDNKELDTLDLTELVLGGTPVTSSADEVNALTGMIAKVGELNLLADTVAAFSFTPAAGAANVCEVTIQAKDAQDVNMTRPVLFLLHLSDDATGLGLTATDASGTVTAKAASGTDFGVLTAKKALLAQTKADGSFILEITDTAKTSFYVIATPLVGCAPSGSAALITADYGA